jgi:spore coat protein CotH
MRYKGNSSLMAATAIGNGKIPFRLDFAPNDQSAQSQTFYGFRKVTFSSNFADDSQLREVLATEVLRNRGVPAARAAFYRVFVDTGEGAKYWGLYTMVEDPSDGAMLDAQLGGRGANLYKPEGPAANWALFDPASFEKKTNEGAKDFSDVMAAINALHSEMTDRSAWRKRLERVFDADLFLRWLAVNTAIGNWDAYGAMAHNYYLYGDAARGGRLRWIPWDHNMAFGAGPGNGRGFPGRGATSGGRFFGAFPGDAAAVSGPAPVPPFPPGRGRRRGGPGRATQDVLHRDVGSEWPLIARLLSDPEYAARYRAFLSDAMAGLMAPEVMARRIRELHELITPAVIGPDGELKNHTTFVSEAAFRDSSASLLGEITRQRTRIQAALAEPVR